MSLLLACRADYPIDEEDTTLPRPPREPAYDPNEPVEVVIKTFELTTNEYTIPIRGTGPTLGWVKITSPNNNFEMEKDIGDSGSFCANIPLSKDQVNSVTFEPFDRTGRSGEPVIKDITQSGSPQVPTPEDIRSNPENIAKGMGGFNKTVEVLDGKMSYLTDGDRSTVVTLDNRTGRRDYLEFDLSREADVENIRIVSPSDCPVEEAIIYMTTQSGVPLTNSPLETIWNDLDELIVDPELEPTNDEWDVWGYVYNSAGNPEVYVSPESTNGNIASRIAIEFTSKDCGLFDFILEGAHKIREIEVEAGPEYSGSGGLSSGANLCEKGN